ncbi:PqiC family protein [Janthinobacterium agaricidamnosum]|uniref:ABC-type transport auxiliary lipoprotein component domain-containing protein n=1 Tax=Janthinobacterium agaricidamnosum NBRC 102515 = DSM 9628 TaxID=1349767 RepID=W0VCH2_9BURK|nr:PqiC family protein [Janthinobacterium agaricidamnosum]CDG84987.1 conserved hypothetical protein [Janthinobacterium agaricidamnosum NBRC 102515 = DSM 9628]
MSRFLHRAGWGALVTSAALLLGACSTPRPEYFYTLNGGPAVAAAPVKPVAYYVEVLAVSVPQQVMRNQLVVTAPSGQIELLEQQRWAGPLAGEIGQALSTALTGELGAIDVFRTPYPDTLPVFRISTNVQRFESVPGQYALIDAVWSVRQLSTNKVLTCRSLINQPVDGPGYDALVAGHRKALQEIAAAMATAVRSFNNGNRAC